LQPHRAVQDVRGRHLEDRRRGRDRRPRPERLRHRQRDRLAHLRQPRRHHGDDLARTVLDSEVHHNNIGLFVGTGTTLKLGGSAVNQNTTNFSNSGTVQSFCDNSTESAAIPGAVTNVCLH
jgi:hypothetical protein